MLSINTNLSSMIVQSSLKQSTNSLNTAIERMTTGAKINHAKDNAANYSIATSLSSKISAYQVAEDNCTMGLDLVQTASSSLATMSDLTSRLRALATQAQNGTYGSRSIEAINSEAQAIVDELFRIRNTTQYNKINLLGTTEADQPKFIIEVTRRDTSAMTTLASVDETVALTSGTYSISTAEELAKLATMTNNGLIGKNTEFVLANDIDLSAYSSGEGWTPIGNDSKYFSATFDGNGYKISNLYINRPDEDYQGLFGNANRTIRNVALINCDVTGRDYVGGLAGYGDYIEISYATGSVTGTRFVGGLVGDGDCIDFSYATGSVTGAVCVGGLAGQGNGIGDCYATGNVTGSDEVGGLVGYGDTIEFSYATGSVDGYWFVGGLVGDLSYDVAIINNCYATGRVTGDDYVGGLVGSGANVTLDNAYYTDTAGQTVGIGEGTPKSGTAQLVTMTELDELIAQGILDCRRASATNSGVGVNLNLQVGVNSNSASQIELNIAHIDISALDGLDMSSTSALATIDEVLAAINEQQTNLGAVENRLMSALDQISVAYDNLVSSLSTIQDADIGEVSSEYIRQQILQQASATLMATANQSPSIALQLL